LVTSNLERAAVALAAKLHESRAHHRRPDYRAELAALEAALRTAPIEREAIEDLPRMIELERHTDSGPSDAWGDYTAGWNAAMETAASIARYVLRRGMPCSESAP
jgi:hypothetical protein